MDASISNTVNNALALQDANVMQEVQARVLKKAINAQADTALTLMQSLPALAVDATLGSRIDTHA
ncbi:MULTISPECIES: YjfB family protein [Achromobacter]|uniref:Putative motility protein n=1 Tax=Alcaligenes xylosoxydans xylosoxydans TaxID=85698 RepID=A0A424W636_ALCXX|nr:MULTISPECIES: YjfB family protein [Achromobacter]MBC9908341.1 YjfB family protein [Achromobacter xylosoxidans]MBD0872111.1 YjfB family protein [Achromobacter xylosoxidans]MDH1304336.1 YjfB family protein [Achromobacter sp. GD03932]QNP83536.1 YjfB family protein [Achromobacter xylosoxidans]RPJ88725.1 putative motility protein [Achromobacter xylosoxidans]